MKKNHRQSHLQRFAFVILIVMVITFIIPTYSYAGIGGVLLDPLVDIVCFLGDSILNLVQATMTGEFRNGLRRTFYGR